MLDQEVEQLAQTSGPRVASQTQKKRIRFGTLFGGVDIITDAWGDHEHVFAVDGTVVEGRPETKILSNINKLGRRHFRPYRDLDALVVTPPRRGREDKHRLADAWVAALHPKTGWRLRPKTVLVLSHPGEALYRRGQPHKTMVKEMVSYGYRCREMFVDAVTCGAAVDQQRWVTLFVRADVGAATLPHLEWTGMRPMSNLLRPPGLVPRYLWRTAVRTRAARKPRPSGATGARVLEEILGDECAGQPDTVRGRIYDPEGPMPMDPSAYVRDPERGVRPILSDEFARALGVPGTWKVPDGQPGLPRILQAATGLHIWRALESTVVDNLIQPGRLRVDTHEPDKETGEREEESSDWTWTLPTLSEDGEWWQQRRAKLWEVTASYQLPDKARYRTEGLATLRRYVRTLEGKETTLNLLWWEWPETHHAVLRDGCPMRFVSDPGESLSPNPTYDADQLETAAEFVDELERLGVIEKVPPGRRLRRNGPLQVIPKEGQPGEWRVLSDMKRGGQNAHIAADPVALPRPADILRSLCEGGYTAVVDVSKEFYHFPTRDSDREYLGLIHPKTGEHYWYRGLPMGSASSPAIAGQGVAALLRDLLRHDMFEGRVILNDVTNHLRGEPYRARWPEGRVIVGADGQPVPIIFVWVDDFLVHASTRSACQAALDLLMDHLVRLGLLAHKKKVKAPAQCQRFCGFDYDTAGRPKVCIPDDKRDHAVALVDFLEHGRGHRLSRLALAVIVGRLQSLVPATAGNVGATYLRSLYAVLHEDDGSGLLPSCVTYYYREARMTEEAWSELQWWREFLAEGLGACIKAEDPAVLVSTHGDGSGTGTGGTVQFDSSEIRTPEDLELWMGVWRPRAMGKHSTWKECFTLLLTLRRDRRSGRFRGRYAFYFTDNIVTYHIVQRGSSSQPALHAIVREIKLLAAEMSVVLEVVHIPGLAIIRQGTDALSRGLWLQPDRRRLSPRQEVSRLFEAATLTPELVDWALVRRGAVGPYPLPIDWQEVTWDVSWHPDRFMKKATIWAPPPRVAAQAIWAAVMAWVEFPAETEALFLIPRICTRDWMRVNKAVRQIGVMRQFVVFGDIVPWTQSDIPILLLHLPPHSPTLPLPPNPEQLSVVDAAPLPAAADWVRSQTAYVRGL